MAVVTVPLLEVAAATPRSRLVVVDIRGQGFDFRAGQALFIGTHGQPRRRPYSIASSPQRTAATGRLELLIALEADGTLGPNLTTTEPGSLVDIEGPLGTFIFPEEATHPHVLFIAGGTGIAPLRSMIDHVLRRDPGRALSLLYSARTGDEFAFIDELREHARAGRLELHQTVTRDDTSTWAGGRGRIGKAHYESVLHDASGTLCFICGPRTMVSESVAVLQGLGVPGGAIRTEAWAVPEGPPAKA